MKIDTSLTTQELKSSVFPIPFIGKTAFDNLNMTDMPGTTKVKIVNVE